MNYRIFHDFEMQGSESPFQGYKSKRILSFANLLLRFRTQSAKKLCLHFAIMYSVTVKSYGINVFETVLMWSVCTKIALIDKNIWKEKIRRQSFVVYVLIYLMSKFWGNRTNSLWVLALYSVHGLQPEAETSPLWCVFHPFHSKSQVVNAKMRAL